MTGTLLGLDVGGVRTGIAISRAPIHIPSTLETVPTEQLQSRLENLVASEHVEHIVVGLPRNMSGDETAQTTYVREMVEALQQHIALPFSFIDEAATSIKAETELKSRGKPYGKEDIDMLAAVFILEDYIHEHPEALRV